MSIDLDKNKCDILKVFDDVLSEKSSTDWALFGYEGQTNVLKVVSWGDEGLDELAEEFNASKIMYGVIKIEDPNTSRPKIILLNWQGEGAPNLRKGVCARHLPEVKRMLKGVHITYTARTEEDVDYEALLNAVAKATSTEYNFKDRSEIPDKNVPVKKLAKKFWSGDVSGAMGTNYRRTNPQSEINASTRNKFWEEQEAEEKVRKEEELKRREEEAKRLELERMERELRDSKHREELNRERNARILADKKAELAAIENEKIRRSVGGVSIRGDDNHQRDAEEGERARRADIMRMERKKEAESLIGHKTHQTRSIFESQTYSQAMPSYNDSKHSLSKPPPKKLKDFSPPSFNDSSLSGSVQSRNETTIPKKSLGTRWPPPAEETVTEKLTKVPGKISEWKPQDSVQLNHTPDLNASQALSSSKLETSSKASSSVRQNNNYFENIQHSKSPPQLSPATPTTSPVLDSSTASHRATPASHAEDRGPPAVSKEQDLKSREDSDHRLRTNGTMEDNVTKTVASPGSDELMDDFSSVCMTYEVDGIEYQILPEHGLCARALYDYQAADDTEITFDPGDIITNIDQIDVGWWQGVSPLGIFGLFPANYVELINGTRVH